MVETSEDSCSETRLTNVGYLSCSRVHSSLYFLSMASRGSTSHVRAWFHEDIPESSGLWNSCDEPTASYPDTKVLHRLSCIAKDHRIYIIANMGDIKYCDIEGDNSCPRDGRYQFNTNVVFDIQKECSEH